MTDAEIEKIIDRSSKKAADETEQRFKKELAKSEKTSDQRMQRYIAILTKESNEQMRQYVGAINEESKHNIEAVGEQYSGLNEKVDKLIITVEETSEKVENTNIRLAGVEIELAEVRRITDATFEAVGNHEERITVLEEKVR